MTYHDAIRRLFSLEFFGIKLGLENITEFCRLLGDPQKELLTVHVAGTNGKGSTSAFLDAILRAAGYSVGRYTSPHLRDFRERVHVRGCPVSQEVIRRFVDRHWPLIRRRHYTFFETTTALALEAFARERVDLAVVEVGLGGRFDATGVVSPTVSIITGIARDHEEILGHTPGKIAFEKAGIIRPGVPVVIGPMVRAAERVIRRVADEQNAPLWSASELLMDNEARDLLPDGRDRWRLPLVGLHQRTNLATALGAVTILRTQGIAIPRSAVRAGIARAHWPARFQILRGHPTIVFDAAHNPDGMRAVATTWQTEFPGRRAVCIFATRPDKKYRLMMQALNPLVEHWLSCPLPGAEGVAREVIEPVARRGGQPFTWAESARTALDRACELAGRDGLVLVTGSHYLVGAVIPPTLVSGTGRSRRTSGSVGRSDLVAAASVIPNTF